MRPNEKGPELGQLRTLILGDDRGRVEAMVQLLARAGLQVRRATSADEALRAWETQSCDLLLIDGTLRGELSVLLPARRLGARPKARVILLDPQAGADLSAWLAELRACSLQPAVVQLGSPYRVLEEVLPLLDWRVPDADGAAPLDDPETSGDPDPDAVNFVVGLWARRHSGVVQVSSQGLLATIYEGDPIDPESRRALILAMWEGGVTFAAGFTPYGSARIPIAPILWDTILRLQRPELVLRRLDHVLVERGAATRALELPVSDSLRRLLEMPRAHTPLREACERAGISPRELAGPLSALITTGFFMLRPAPAASEPARAPIEAPPTRPATPPMSGGTRQLSSPPRPAPPPPEIDGKTSFAATPRPQARSGYFDDISVHSVEAPRRTSVDPSHLALLLSRLQKEWERIERADDWTALGVPKGSTPELVSRALERLERRYDDDTVREAQNAALSEISQKLLARVREASKNIRAGRASGGVLAVPPHQTSFEQGLRALTAKDFHTAARWFHVAREQEPNSSLYAGYLGWAIWNNPQLDLRRRHAKGRELLELADVSGDPVAATQTFLAAVEADAGEHEQATARVARALRIDPEFGLAKALQRRLRDRRVVDED